jgi:hypothetical protein
MIKGLAITPPVIGRISIGKLVQKQERWLPEKDDSFSLTTQVQSRDGWLLHPLHQALSEQAQNGKIRAIPIQLLFNDSELNLRAEYSAFDRNNGRPVCVGNGDGTTGHQSGHGRDWLHGSRPLSAGQGAGLQAVWSAQCPGGGSAG